ncbi:hypothetical protein RB601_007821 [Gaeumannomyces tritici]
MADASSETSPLLPAVSAGSSPVSPRPNARRTVTFNPNPVTRTIEPDPPAVRRRVSHDVSHHSRPHSLGGSAPSTPASTMSVGSLAAGPPMFATINNKLRRRNSHGAIGATYHGGAANTNGHNLLPAPGGLGLHPGAIKVGPQRSTKKAQKLKLLPTPEQMLGEELSPDEESGREVYSQYTRIKDPTARRDAARLGKADRDRLPRVTAYCTANRYQMEGLMRFLKGGRGRAKGANPKLIDECIYTPYQYKDLPLPERGARTTVSKASSTAVGKDDGSNPEGAQGAGERGSPPLRRHSTGEVDATIPRFSHGDLIDLEPEPLPEMEPETPDLGRPRSREGQSHGEDHEHSNGFHPESTSHTHGDMIGGPAATVVGDDRALTERPADLDIEVHTPEVFLFDYGVVVIWGMSIAQEQRFLKEIAKFETEKLALEDVETEYFNFYYTREYQPRIYNDFITLRDKKNYMTKLAISHALAQSVKTSLFEELIASTIDTCKDIPTQIALTGKINLSRTRINMQIGELFILRINIHLNGSVLDTPEIFWVEPQLEPLYQAVRTYLEMDQRVGLLTERLDVIADLLAVLKDQLSHGHGEKLEWIVIVLIAAEILVALINIVVDLYAGVD